MATLFSLEFFDKFFPRLFNKVTYINKIPMISLNLVYYLLDIEYASHRNMTERYTLKKSQKHGERGAC